MKNKILILGPGYIGSRLKEGLGAEVSGDLIRSFQDAQTIVKKHNPKVIINCIGYIGRNVDDCELDKDKTLTANSFIPLILAEVALRNNIKLVHISTGCIYHFDYAKDRPIIEEKEPDFFELFYSRSKMYSDLPLKLLSKKYPVLIARIRVPLDDRPCPKNLLDKLIHYKNVIDLPNTVTYIPDFIAALKHLIKIDARGIYNIAVKGALVYPKILELYKRHVPDFNYKVIHFKNLGLVRTNLILSTKKLEKTGFKVRSINEVIKECVDHYVKY